MTEDILLEHFSRYPQMKPQDAVKLLYQMEFGPEHMIQDEKKSLKMLCNEMASLRPDPEEALYEGIGGGLCRLNLRACMARNIPAEDINELFVLSSRLSQGDKRRFRRSLDALRSLADQDETPFDPVELDLFLARYPDSLPAVHHSEAYRNAYRPAYRVVSQKKVKDYLARKRAEEAKP